TIPIITRIFGPGDFGNYSLVSATIAIFTTICGWIGMSVIRFYPVYQKEKEENILFGNLTLLLEISIMVCSIVYILFLHLIKLPTQLSLLLKIGLIVAVVSSAFDSLLFFFRAQRRVALYSNFMIWKSLSTFGLGLALVIGLGLGIEGLLWGTVIGLIIALPLVWKLFTTRLKLVIKISTPFIRQMLAYSAPLVISNLAAWVLSMSNRYILQALCGAAAVGVFSASYMITERSLMLLVTLFLMASGPLSFEIWEKDGIEASRLFISRVTRYYLMIMVPATIGLIALSQPVMVVMAGQDYFMGYRIMPLVATSVLFIGIQQRFQAGYSFYNQTRGIAMATISAGVINLALNFMLDPVYGYMGAAIASFISYVVLLAVMVIGSRRIYTWSFPFRSLINTCAAGLIMGLMVYVLSDLIIETAIVALLIGIPVGIIAYFAMLHLFKEFTPEEIAVLKSLTLKIGR
ncbi:MAG: polysaccharide biosynthesis C-terminal domain-containing protein, partial [Syntrophomonas sp.]